MTSLLLDTHTLVWWLFDDPSLSDAARAAISDGGATILVSAVSAFEITNKHRLGRWPALGQVVADFDAAITAAGFSLLSLSPRHAATAGLLTGDHRDPFDRMIAAQGLIEDMPVVTRDREIANFGAKVLW